MSASYQRPYAAILARRLAETRRFIQVVAGPGRVDKTTHGQKMRSRGSSPKLQVLNTVLMTARAGMTLEEARSNSEF
jgi:hypothetical protein